VVSRFDFEFGAFVDGSTVDREPDPGCLEIATVAIVSRPSGGDRLAVVLMAAVVRGCAPWDAVAPISGRRSPTIE
jgi:hypothetical protein